MVQHAVQHVLHVQSVGQHKHCRKTETIAGNIVPGHYPFNLQTFSLTLKHKTVQRVIQNIGKTPVKKTLKIPLYEQCTGSNIVICFIFSIVF